jgi:hypothetical protein
MTTGTLCRPCVRNQYFDIWLTMLSITSVRKSPNMIWTTGLSLGDLDDAWRIATPDNPIPYSPPLEDAHLPGAERIAAEIGQRLGR